MPASIAYVLRPVPGTEASVEGTRKSNANASEKTVRKRAKFAPTKKVGVVKLIRSRAKSGVKRPCEMAG
jgi:hypothetical protein